MVKAVKGFITDDGKFFETQDEADLYESEEELKQHLAELEVSEDALVWILQLRHEIQDYLTAFEAVNAQVPNTSKSKGL